MDGPMKRCLIVACAGLLLTVPVTAQQVELGGEVRPRFEVRNPVVGPAGSEVTREFTSMRSRLSARATLSEGIVGFVQLQDVRVWGSEQSTTDPSADALDMHQAWVELGDPAAGRFALRLGRQELSYGGQRLIGALDWVQQARAFDGGRLRFRPSDRLALDGLALRIGDEDAGQPDAGLYGLYATANVAGSLEGYLLYHTQDTFLGVQPISEDQSKRYTIGGRWASSVAGLDWRVEAAYQAGETVLPPAGTGPRPADDIAAYLFAVRAGTRVGDRLGVALWYDHLSGDDDLDDGRDRVFDTLFATNHKFYGYMDLFTDIPRHTARRGLQDLAMKTTYQLAESHTLAVDLHSFFFAATDGLDRGHIGEELDITYAWRYAPRVSITGGASYFRAGGAAPLPAAPAVAPGEGMVWGYAMIGVAF
jgi:hypothetical protein